MHTGVTCGPLRLQKDQSLKNELQLVVLPKNSKKKQVISSAEHVNYRQRRTKVRSFNGRTWDLLENGMAWFDMT